MPIPCSVSKLQYLYLNSLVIETSIVIQTLGLYHAFEQTINLEWRHNSYQVYHYTSKKFDIITSISIKMSP